MAFEFRPNCLADIWFARPLPAPPNIPPPDLTDVPVQRLKPYIVTGNTWATNVKVIHRFFIHPDVAVALHHINNIDDLQMSMREQGVNDSLFLYLTDGGPIWSENVIAAWYVYGFFHFPGGS